MVISIENRNPGNVNAERPAEIITKLITEFRPLIMATIKRKIRAFGSAEDINQAAEDLFQEVSISIFRKFKDDLSDLDQKTISGLISIITTRACIHWIQKNYITKGRKYAFVDDKYSVELAGDDQATAEVNIAGFENESLRTAVEGLPEKERKAVELVFFQDKTLKQAAEELGYASTNSVSHRLKTAIEKLRKRFDGNLQIALEAVGNNDSGETEKSANSSLGYIDYAVSTAPLSLAESSANRESITNKLRELFSETPVPKIFIQYRVGNNTKGIYGVPESINYKEDSLALDLELKNQQNLKIKLDDIVSFRRV